MFTTPTVFIVGAGASWHYGFPTGEELVAEIAEKAARFGQHCGTIVQPPISAFQSDRPAIVRRHASGNDSNSVAESWKKMREECATLITRLQAAHPLVIDYFLEWNDTLDEIGRFFIAWVLFEREAKFRDGQLPQSAAPHQNNWCRFIVSKLLSRVKEPKDFLTENRVSFITFNYDTSLEDRLAGGISAYPPFQQYVNDFFETHAVIHVYGKVHDAPQFIRHVAAPQRLDQLLARPQSHPGTEIQKLHAQLNEIQSASGLLKTIPHSKDDHDAEIERARTAIREAQDIYILGYGFDEQNSERLRLKENISNMSSAHRKNVYFTNLDGHGRILKRANRLFDAQLSVNAPTVWYQGRNKAFDMSIRNVYDAFAKDFEFADS